MRWRRSQVPLWTYNVSLLLALASCCFLLLLPSANAAAVMSVDLGSEWMKVAVVSVRQCFNIPSGNIFHILAPYLWLFQPGVPMEIALNRESKRKTASAVSLRGDERTFGSDALSNGVRFPKTCYWYLLDLLGKPVAHPQVQRWDPGCVPKDSLTFSFPNNPCRLP